MQDVQDSHTDNHQEPVDAEHHQSSDLSRADTEQQAGFSPPVAGHLQTQLAVHTSVPVLPWAQDMYKSRWFALLVFWDLFRVMALFFLVIYVQARGYNGLDAGNTVLNANVLGFFGIPLIVGVYVFFWAIPAFLGSRLWAAVRKA